MTALLVASVVLACGPGDDPPEPRVPVGKDTTFVTGPLDKSGYIDYEAALHERLGKGVPPENNANVLIWKALGPTPEGGKPMPPEYFRRLGAAEPPRDGDYFLDGHTFARRAKLDEDAARAFYDQQTECARRPWTAKEFPRVAEWLRANEKPLAVALQAAARPAYYNPLVSTRKGDISCLLGCLLPSTQKCREVAVALAARAMLRTAEGQPDDAWADLLACHRLGRHLTHGATFIEALVGIAVRAVAANATLAYLERSDLPAEKILARLREFRALPAAAPMADKVALGERLMCLDSIQMIRSGRTGEPGKPTAAELRALDAIDWEPAFRKANRLYDRMAEIMRTADRPARERRLDALERELNELVKKGRDFQEIQRAVEEGDPDKVGKAVGGEIGDVLIALLVPGVRKCQSAGDRALQIDRNLEVAFALAAHRKEAGRYPAKLADLAPKYLKDVPDDLFTGGPLVYRLTDTGFLLYSAGENGKDDGGRSFDDDPRGDDLRVRVPAQR